MSLQNDDDSRYKRFVSNRVTDEDHITYRTKALPLAKKKNFYLPLYPQSEIIF